MCSSIIKELNVRSLKYFFDTSWVGGGGGPKNGQILSGGILEFLKNVLWTSYRGEMSPKLDEAEGVKTLDVDRRIETTSNMSG